MKTSVVVSTYNGAEYICEQLDSLRQQERTADEVLIFDDRSSDQTAQIVQDYLDRYELNDSWKLVVNQVNKGWRRNFIEGVWAANGDIVFTCDQDDIWRKDKIKIMSELMEQHGEIELLTSNYCEFTQDSRKAAQPWENDQSLHQIKLETNYLLVQSPGCTHCLSRHLVELSKKYWQEGYPHDALMWRLAEFSDGLYTYTDTLIDWRKHNTSAFTKESKDLKTIAEKKKWIRDAKSFNSTLGLFLNEDVKGNKARQAAILKRGIKWLNARRIFYESRSILAGIKLAFYWDCYPRYRQYLGDWYLLFIKRK